MSPVVRNSVFGLSDRQRTNQAKPLQRPVIDIRKLNCKAREMIYLGSKNNGANQPADRHP